MRNLPTAVWVRFAFIALLWIALVALLLRLARNIDFFTVFAIVASGIIVFVPLWKKYVRNDK